MLRRSLLAGVLAGALLVGACSSDTTSPPVSGNPITSAPTTTSTTTTAVPAVDTAAQGEFGVGRRTVTVVDGTNGDRSLTVDIWYPTDATSGAPSTYTFAPGIQYDSAVALDSPAVSSGGPFPLAVYSHGSGGLRYVASYFTETLASHGVVVVAPDHAGNTTLDGVLGTTDAPDVIARNRPADVSAVITAMLDGSVAPDVTAAVDGDHVGVVGHSFGGYTALAAGGGVSALGISPDDRVDAVVAMAPAAGLLSDADLAADDLPTMVVSGTLDTTTPIDPNTERVASLVTGRPLYRVDLVGATHQSFTDVCQYVPILENLPAVTPAIRDLLRQEAGNTCDPEVLDPELAHQLIDRYAIAFLLAQLTGSDQAQAVLTADGAPEEVRFEAAGA